MRPELLLLGSLLPLISTGVYVVSILRGVSKPQRMTRLLMLVIGILSCVTLLASHDHSGIWLAFASFVQAAILWFLSFRYGVGGKDGLDFICFVLCLSGLILWLVSGKPLFGLVMSIVADLVACVPSIVKTYRMPLTESWLFYGIDMLAGVAILYTSPHTVVGSIYPAYIALINGLFVGIILIRARWIVLGLD